MNKKWIWISVIVVGILLTIVIGRSCSKKESKSDKTNSESYNVIKGEISSQVQITGEIQPQMVVAVKSKVSGTIVKYYAEENDYVKQGQKIADIEPDFNQANTLFNTKSQLGLAKQSLDLAVKTEAEKKQLLAQNVISQKDYDSSLEDLQRARIEYVRAKAQYDMISDLDTSGKVTHVFATASGVVIERRINEGEMVVSSAGAIGEGTVIMKIADLSKMIVKASINEVDIPKFSIGQEAKITLDALPYEEFRGKINKIAPMAVVDNNARVFPVEISIDSGGEKTRPGMTANVSILGETKKDILIIPIRAVFSDDKNQDIVYLIPSGNIEKSLITKKKTQDKYSSEQYIQTPVKLGTNDLQNVEVIAGLKEGDIISLSTPPQGPDLRFGMD